MVDVGSQQAGNISNVDGNQHIVGSQTADVGGQTAYVMDPRDALGTLRGHLAELFPDAGKRAKAERDLRDVDHGLATGQMTRGEAAGRLQRVLEAARGAGNVID
jgi:hypothetical protein